MTGRFLLCLLLLPFCLVMSGYVWAQDSPRPTRLTGTSAQLLGGADAASFADNLPVNEEVVWQVYVPETYDASRPAGLLIYISPTPSGRMPSGWKDVMDEQNLIYMAANKSGNKVDTIARMLFALMAPKKLAETFELDPSRIYISGFSGGGRVASYAASLFPEVFTGGLYICGVEYATLAEPKPAFHERRHVLLTGHRDFNRQETRQRYEAMKAGGAAQVHLMDIPNFDHELPRTRHLTEAITFLDTGQAGN